MHAIVLALLFGLAVATLAWWRLYRGHGSSPPREPRAYRLHQLLVAAIAALTIVIAMLIVLSSDPGNPEEFLYWP